MKKFFDKFLLSLLWLTATLLATAFWMGARYGFNILSGSHWAYLSELQAQRTHVKPGFYISLVIALVIALVGLYLILRPHSAKVTKSEKTEQTTIANAAPSAPPAPTAQIVSSARRPIAPAGLGVGVRNAPAPATHPTQTAYTPQFTVPPAPSITPPQNPQYDEISKAFESAGYIVKKCNKIGNLLRPVLAIGYDQTVLLGSSNISPTVMQDAIENLVTIFDDTLGNTAEDIEVRGFIVNASDGEQASDLISLFDGLAALKDDIQPNEKPAAFDQELFDAFSTYIDTVCGYIGK